MPGMAASSVDAEGDPTQKKLGVFFWICAGGSSSSSSWPSSPTCSCLPNPTFQNYSAPQNAGPALGHLLGTDDLNRDILSRLVYGARVSLVVGFGGAAIGMVIGGIPAMISAYRRGRTDTFLNTTSYVLLAFPVIVALIVIIDFWGRSLRKITLIIGLFSAPLIFRVIRASTLSYATPGLRAGGQGPGGQRPPHPGPGDPAQHHADRRVLRPDRRGHHHRARGHAGLPRAFRRAPDTELGQHAR